jgi:hypothetical protein
MFNKPCQLTKLLYFWYTSGFIFWICWLIAYLMIVRSWWLLFQKRVVLTKFNIYVFIQHQFLFLRPSWNEIKHFFLNFAALRFISRTTTEVSVSYVTKQISKFKYILKTFLWKRNSVFPFKSTRELKNVFYII